MALAFKETISINMPTGFTPIGADADDDNIYIHAQSSTEGRILTFPLTGGERTNTLNVTHNAAFCGLAKFGDGWVVSRGQRLQPISSTGDLGTPSDFISGLGKNLGIVYDPVSEYFFIHGYGASGYFDTNWRVFALNTDFDVLSTPYALLKSNFLLKYKSQTTECGATAKVRSKYYFYERYNGLIVTDANFGNLNESQALPVETNTSVRFSTWTTDCCYAR